MSGKKTSTGRLGGKLMLSGALILGSGAYAWWQHEPDTAQMAAAPRQVVATDNPRPDSPPRLGGQPAPQAETTAMPPPMPVRRSGDEAPAQNAGPQALAPGTPSNVPLPPPGAVIDQRTVMASTAPPGAPPPSAAARYADGDYIGQPADTAWGNVQVRASIRNGAIARVEAIDYPDHRLRSIAINEDALPTLGQEAIQAQSAEIDIVTQATTSSLGYRQSLATALAQAKKQP